MDAQAEQLKATSLALCEKLRYALEGNREDAERFFGGEIYKSYVEATDKAINKVNKTKNKIRNL